MANLRVFLLAPAGTDTWAVGKTYAVTVAIRAPGASKGVAQLQYDKDLFVLVDSLSSVALQSAQEQQVTWYVKPLKAAPQTALVVTVTVDQLVQAAVANVRVIAKT